MKLSGHFDSAKFACRCGCGFDCPHADLVKGLELLRLKIGHPVLVNSGCRCGQHNSAVGGSPHSQHLYGRAADVRVNGMTGEEIYSLARTIPVFRGFGVAGGWLHVDVRPGPVARWKYDREGRVIAWPEGKTA